MTTEDYNLAQFLFDVATALIGFLLGGGAGLILEYKFNIIRNINQRFNQGEKNNLITAAENSTVENQYSGESSLEQSSNGVQAVVKDCPGANISIGTKISTSDDALGDPDCTNTSQVVDLRAEADFLHLEISKFFRKNGQEYDTKYDYGVAETYKSKNQNRPAATLYIRVFGPLIDLLNQTNNINYATSLDGELNKLRSLSIDGASTENLNSIIERIEKILYEFFGELR